MKPSEFNISLSVKSYNEKTVENYRNCYVAEKPIASKLSKISIPNLIAQIGGLNEDCAKISLFYLLYFLRNKPFILNYSASPEMVIRIYSNYFPIYFFKFYLELF